VLVRVYDTRVFHKFGDPYVKIMHETREAQFTDLKGMGLSRTPQNKDFQDPNVFVTRLPVVSQCEYNLSLDQKGQAQ
jgi:hypothetical protein